MVKKQESRTKEKKMEQKKRQTKRQEEEKGIDVQEKNLYREFGLLQSKSGVSFTADVVKYRLQC